MIAARWRALAEEWARKQAIIRERRQEAAATPAAFQSLPAPPADQHDHRWEWVPTQPRQVCARCHAETDLTLVEGRSVRVWWVDGAATTEKPACRAPIVLAAPTELAPPARVIDAELVEEEPEIVVVRVPRPRRPRTERPATARPSRPPPATRPSRRPSKETQAFLDGEDAPDSATIREFERESETLGITHADIAGEREIELIKQAQAGIRADAVLAEGVPGADRTALLRDSRLGRQAANTLLLAHDKLIRMYANRYSRITGSRHGVDFDDLLQEARRGFLHGITKFLEAPKAKLTSYAGFWMLQCMGRTLDKTRGLVPLPFNVIERAKRAAKTGEPITAEALIKAGKTPINPDIAAAAAAVWSGRDISVNETVGGPSADDDESASLKIAGYLQSDEDVEAKVAEAEVAGRRAALVQKALAQLTGQERTVAERRLMGDPPDPLEDVGRDLGMTREGARLIEVKVRGKLAAFLAAQARANDVDAEVLGDVEDWEGEAEVDEAA